MPSQPSIGPDAAARERSIVLALGSDCVMLVAIVAAALRANSLTMLAETLRGALLMALEFLLLILMRRIHRGRVHRFDYGIAKLEQFGNRVTGTAMGLAGVWVAVGAFDTWGNPSEHPGPGLVFAAAVGAANLVQNGLAFLGLWRAGRDLAHHGGQIRSRLTKTVSSALVPVLLVVQAVVGDSPVVVAAAVIGAAFVSVVTIELAVTMWRRSLPSLLDRTLDEESQAAINRVLAQRFHAYESLVSVRSRTIGDTPVVEVAPGFAPERTMGSVQGVVEEVRADVTALIPGAEVRVTPVGA
ncbi:cation transporter [Roseomonas sp. CCTCC AB2023176]|uniref:cation transporter n=1 Tax=Roseomonas sp. CCTCC AB2023176 TaxID=3342640 RepID=UPI0035DE5E98